MATYVPRSIVHLRSVVRNAGWSSVDLIVLPVLLLIATPILIHHLGIEQYGLWMLVNSIASMVGVAGLGFGDTTLKFVSHYRAKSDAAAIVSVIRTGLLGAITLGLASALGIAFVGPLLVQFVFKIAPELHLVASHAIVLGGGILALKMVESVCIAALRGYERYDLSAAATMTAKIGTILTAVALALMGHSIVAILLGGACWSAIGISLACVFVKRLIPEIHLWPSFEVSRLREVLGFGLWSWAQGLSGTIFSQADRFLIGSLIGAGALGQYSACLQIAQQLHALLAAASSSLFPITSAIHSNGEMGVLHSLYHQAIAMLTSLAVAIVIPVYLLAPILLTAWLGEPLASQCVPILQALIIAFGALAGLTIAPYFVLNGTGFIRINVYFGVLSAVTVGTATYFGVQHWGMIGAAMAHLANLPQIVVGLFFVERYVFNERAPGVPVALAAAYLLPVGAVVLSDRLYACFPTQSLSLVLSASVLSVLGAYVAFSLTKLARSYRPASPTVRA